MDTEEKFDALDLDAFLDDDSDLLDEAMAREGVEGAGAHDVDAAAAAWLVGASPPHTPALDLPPKMAPYAPPGGLSSTHIAAGMGQGSDEDVNFEEVFGESLCRVVVAFWKRGSLSSRALLASLVR
jgi:hypothetical protein